MPKWHNALMIRTFVSHLECSLTGERLPAGRVHGLSPAGRPLLVRYDLPALRAAVDRDLMTARPGGFWRYRELLPVTDSANVVSLGEVVTPLIPIRSTPTATAGAGAEALVKDEGRLPTGSFKARGLALAVAMARELGLDHLAMPTNGNAGAALAAYATRAGLVSTVFCPADTPEINIRETAMQGARVHRVDGLINDCGARVAEGREAHGWFDLSTLKEPYRIEGKKTMGIELAEQLGWTLPDAIFYPTGGGTGLIGMWKAFDELEALGWIGSARPRMFAVQAAGCAPIVRAFDAGEEFAEPWRDAHTVAAGIRVPAAVGDFLILRAVRESGGAALAVTDAQILAAQAAVARQEGLLLCPEGAATVAAWEQALQQGLLGSEARVVLFNCATGLKYPMPEV
ncbi:MAG: threonine synthase [Gammaproteobacteria bacterium]|nr:threonine synthase [Gammaproteobacteria bacterium]